MHPKYSLLFLLIAAVLLPSPVSAQLPTYGNELETEDWRQAQFRNLEERRKVLEKERQAIEQERAAIEQEHEKAKNPRQIRAYNKRLREFGQSVAAYEQRLAEFQRDTEGFRVLPPAPGPD